MYIYLFSYVGNPGFGIHYHRMDSVNPGFIWRAPLVNPIGFLWIHVQGFIKWAKKNPDLRGVFLRCADCPHRVQNLRAEYRRGS